MERACRRLVQFVPTNLDRGVVLNDTAELARSLYEARLPRCLLLIIYNLQRAATR